MKTFEAQLEITKENAKAYNERQKALLDSKLKIYEEMAKQSNEVKLENIDETSITKFCNTDFTD